ncbi:MAG: SatD family protein [Thermoplasmatota archaeon]
MDKKYVALVGDIIGSAKIKNRGIYGKKLARSIEEANRRFEAKLFAKCMVVKGDEIAGVLKNIETTYDVAREIQEHLLPVKIRFAAVYDDLDVALETRNASQIDGAAFKRADSHLEKLKKKARQTVRNTKKPFDYFYFDLGKKSLDREITTIANLTAIIKYSHWKGKKDIIYSYEKRGKQEAVAQKLDITQQAVSKALRRAHWKEVRDAEKLINELLMRYTKNE